LVRSNTTLYGFGCDCWACIHAAVALTIKTARQEKDSIRFIGFPLIRSSSILMRTKERRMNTTDMTYRRGFIGRIFGAVAAAGFIGAGTAEAQNKTAAAPAAGPDAWIGEVK